MNDELKTYFVETRATVRRTYEVQAANSREAISASVEAAPSHEVDEFEETTSVTEGCSTDDC